MTRLHQRWCIVKRVVERRSFVSLSHTETPMMNIEDKSPAERRNGFLATCGEYRRLNFILTQEDVNRFAAEWGIEAPQLRTGGRYRPPVPSANGNKHGGF
jgi:hypothetical protein